MPLDRIAPRDAEHARELILADRTEAERSFQRCTPESIRDPPAAAEGRAWARRYGLGVLAQAYLRLQRPAEGLGVVEEALELTHNLPPYGSEAELYRLKGDLLVQAKGARRSSADAEACFQHAVDIASRKQSKSLELRATLSLSRLWRKRGKEREARDRLAAIYAWFTEGFDDPDLREARALLDDLA
jgi:hypothetical protein